jgi:hypothetical protein
MARKKNPIGLFIVLFIIVLGVGYYIYSQGGLPFIQEQAQKAREAIAPSVTEHPSTAQQGHATSYTGTTATPSPSPASPSQRHIRTQSQSWKTAHTKSATTKPARTRLGSLTASQLGSCQAHSLVRQNSTQTDALTLKLNTRITPTAAMTVDTWPRISQLRPDSENRRSPRPS